MRRSVRRILLAQMTDDPARVAAGLEYLRVSQQLERIGDLSTNISEAVVFLVEGKSIKHNLERARSEDSPDGGDAHQVGESGSTKSA